MLCIIHILIPMTYIYIYNIFCWYINLILSGSTAPRIIKPYFIANYIAHQNFDRKISKTHNRRNCFLRKQSYLPILIIIMCVYECLWITRLDVGTRIHIRFYDINHLNNLRWVNMSIYVFLFYIRVA